MDNKNNLPAAPEIERSILGSILLKNDCLDKIIQILKPEVFYESENKIIYSTMINMYNFGLPIDPFTLYESLKKENKLEACGGSEYINKISMYISSVASVEYHSKIICTQSAKRKMLLAADNIKKKIDLEDISDIQAEALNEFENIFENLEGNSDKTLWDEFNDTIIDIDKRYSGNSTSGLTSKTFPTLNHFTGGIRENDYIGILGDYKQGKSYLAQQIALDIAIYDKLPVGIFSLEMNKQSLYHRAFSLRTGIDYSKLRNPKNSKLTPDEFQSFIRKAKDIFKDTKIYIADKVLDKNKIKATMKLWKRKHGVKLFVVDYLNLIELNEKKERRDLEIAALSRFFKNTATKLQVPIIVLSQVNDKGISAEGKGLMRDADFLISVKKPLEAGISNIETGKDKVFNFNKDHFLITLEHSRHGTNGFNFVAAFVNNNFVEIDVLKSVKLSSN